MDRLISGEDEKVIRIISDMKIELARKLADCAPSLEELLSLRGEARTLKALEQRFLAERVRPKQKG